MFASGLFWPSLQGQTQVAAERIVALTSISADLIYQLSPDKLVGVPSGRLLDEDPRFAEIARVGLGNGPNLEQIVALKPDVVLGAADFHEDIGRRLQALGIPVQFIDLDSWDALAQITVDLAQLTGADPALLLKSYEDLIPAKRSQGPQILLLAGLQPLLSPNKNSWAGDLLSQFGVQNLTAELQSQGQFQGYVTLAEEKILEADPEILLLVNPQSPDPLADFQSRPFWKQLQAVKSEQVYVFDYYGLVNPGSLNKIEAACLKLQEILS
ncbi:MAG: ABC transporter substrate-binding protein [Synechococcaceae cyanobacterium SM2_3_1]|nr:ABC transporter substrate-binding protein [Synechococcaceae cyanobacterium SM2_3_1]